MVGPEFFLYLEVSLGYIVGGSAPPPPPPPNLNAPVKCSLFGISSGLY